ncbi:Cyclic nucleotide-binding protein [Pseudocohnilembus persalinus]|uniref:Cyclic nucleotide-binding protein n=1 Tax=Pseudocohnilembus persalinus TaxID=266149 RepID=A0A0V0Q835_PSEPJ|nr:Cyclic nucleotide-binding protein [Pseudocohnilembus persalinus]|eukprot:KRW98331.1 Cyclic nucleotide-binding protein [Pseudocohnilembus persalinus]
MTTGSYIQVINQEQTFNSVQTTTNIFDPQIMYDKHEEFLNNINQNPQSGHKKHNVNPQKTAKNNDNNKKTLITFDNGATWQPLSPPITDQEFCSLQENCSLHLNSYSSSHKFGPIYSVEKAGGLIIGTGNIGAQLSTYQDQVNTYVSIDGGWVWKQVEQGSHIYEIGDQGSVVVMASDQQATNFIIYSIDDGQTWQKYQFQDQKIEVINIVTDPENKGLHFLILGKQVDQSTGLQTGVIIYFNLETLFIGRCQGYQNPQILGSDFQIVKTNQCVLGQKMQHIIKRSGSKCYNGVDFQRTKNAEICQCTELDWICDDGYQRDQQMNQCVLPDGTQNIDLNQSPPEQCFYYYQISMGYKKIPGNICEGGVDHSPIVKQCPQLWDKQNFKHFIEKILPNTHQDNLVEQLCQNMVKFNKQQGEIIYNEGDLVNGKIYIVFKGQVRQIQTQKYEEKIFQEKEKNNNYSQQKVQQLDQNGLQLKQNQQIEKEYCKSSNLVHKEQTQIVQSQNSQSSYNNKYYQNMNGFNLEQIQSQGYVFGFSEFFNQKFERQKAIIVHSNEVELLSFTYEQFQRFISGCQNYQLYEMDYRIIENMDNSVFEQELLKKYFRSFMQSLQLNQEQFINNQYQMSDLEIFEFFEKIQFLKDFYDRFREKEHQGKNIQEQLEKIQALISQKQLQLKVSQKKNIGFKKVQSLFYLSQPFQQNQRNSKKDDSIEQDKGIQQQKDQNLIQKNKQITQKTDISTLATQNYENTLTNLHMTQENNDSQIQIKSVNTIKKPELVQQKKSINFSAQKNEISDQDISKSLISQLEEQSADEIITFPNFKSNQNKNSLKKQFSQQLRFTNNIIKSQQLKKQNTYQPYSSHKSSQFNTLYSSSDQNQLFGENVPSYMQKKRNSLKLNRRQELKQQGSIKRFLKEMNFVDINNCLNSKEIEVCDRERQNLKNFWSSNKEFMKALIKQGEEVQKQTFQQKPQYLILKMHELLKQRPKPLPRISNINYATYIKNKEKQQKQQKLNSPMNTLQSIQSSQNLNSQVCSLKNINGSKKNTYAQIQENVDIRENLELYSKNYQSQLLLQIKMSQQNKQPQLMNQTQQGQIKNPSQSQQQLKFQKNSTAQSQQQNKADEDGYFQTNEKKIYLHQQDSYFCKSPTIQFSNQYSYNSHNSQYKPLFEQVDRNFIDQKLDNVLQKNKLQKHIPNRYELQNLEQYIKSQQPYTQQTQFDWINNKLLQYEIKNLSQFDKQKKYSNIEEGSKTVFFNGYKAKTNWNSLYQTQNLFEQMDQEVNNKNNKIQENKQQEYFNDSDDLSKIEQFQTQNNFYQSNALYSTLRNSNYDTNSQDIGLKQFRLTTNQVQRNSKNPTQLLCEKKLFQGEEKIVDKVRKIENEKQKAEMMYKTQYQFLYAKNIKERNNLKQNKIQS